MQFSVFFPTTDLSLNVFSRMHATLQPALSIRQMLHVKMLYGQMVGGEKLELMLTQSSCAGAGTELGKIVVKLS